MGYGAVVGTSGDVGWYITCGDWGPEMGSGGIAAIGMGAPGPYGAGPGKPYGTGGGTPDGANVG